MLCSQHTHQTDGSGSDDDDPRFSCTRSLAHRIEAVGQRLCKYGFCTRQTIGPWNQDAFGDGDVFSECTGTVHSKQLPVNAEIRVSPATGRTFPAMDQRVNYDLTPLRPTTSDAPYLLDKTTEFMSHDQRRGPSFVASFECFKLRTADAAVGDTNKNL